MSPIKLLRIAGMLDGISLLTLLCIAMPLKYFADYPLAVTINGTLHGGIFVFYALTIIYAALRIQWSAWWSIAAVAAAFIPLGNFVLEWQLKRVQHQYTVKPLKKSWLVYGIIFFSFIDLFAQLPVMSTFATSVGSTAFVAGIVVGMYSFTNTFGNILSGIFTDRLGPFKLLVFGLITTSMSLLSYHLIEGPTSLLIVRCVHGFFGGLIVPAAFTLLANTTANDKQGSKSAVTGSFIGIAAIIGPAFSGILASRTSVPNVFVFVALFGAILTIATILFLRIQVNREKKQQSRVSFEWNTGVLKSFGGAFFLMFSQGVLAYLLPLHVEALGYSSRMSGTLMSMFGIIAVLMFVLPTNRIFDKVQSVYTLLIGVCLMAISQILIGQSATTLTLYAVLGLYGLGFAFLFPSITTLLIKSTTSETRGKAYGIFYAFFSLGVVVGSSLLGMLPFNLQHSFLFTGVVLLSFAAVVVTDTLLQKRQKANISRSA